LIYEVVDLCAASGLHHDWSSVAKLAVVLKIIIQLFTPHPTSSFRSLIFQPGTIHLGVFYFKKFVVLSLCGSGFQTVGRLH
jgi:hypothetical protein